MQKKGLPNFVQIAVFANQAAEELTSYPIQQITTISQAEDAASNPRVFLSQANNQFVSWKSCSMHVNVLDKMTRPLIRMVDSKYDQVLSFDLNSWTTELWRLTFCGRFFSIMHN